MDGFAVRFDDTKYVGAELEVLGEVPAGEPNKYQLGPGQAVRVFTGTPMPLGADHVLIQEHTERGEGAIKVTKSQAVARHIRLAGGDFTLGQMVLEAGDRLTPSKVGLAAAANHSSLSVRRQPRVSILTSGSELRPPGSVLAEGQMVESNSYTLSKLLAGLGALVERLPTCKDDQKSITDRFLSASDADLIVVVGGASAGKYDLVRTAFSALNGEFVFERVLVRPGKPTWFGTLGRQCVLGLPGTPTAAFVMASLLLKPLLAEAEQIEFQPAILSSELREN